VVTDVVFLRAGAGGYSNIELNLIGFLEGTDSGIMLGGAFSFCLEFMIVEFFFRAEVLLCLRLDLWKAGSMAGSTTLTLGDSLPIGLLCSSLLG
jgi:hypothetical protein